MTSDTERERVAREAFRLGFRSAYDMLEEEDVARADENAALEASMNEILALSSEPTEGGEDV